MGGTRATLRHVLQVDHCNEIQIQLPKIKRNFFFLILKISNMVGRLASWAGRRLLRNSEQLPEWVMLRSEFEGPWAGMKQQASLVF